MGGGESTAITNYITIKDRTKVTEINTELKKNNEIYKKFDPFNKDVDLCIGLQMLHNIIEKYQINQILSDRRRSALNISDKDIIRMMVNEQNDKYNLELQNRYLLLLLDRIYGIITFYYRIKVKEISEYNKKLEDSLEQLYIERLEKEDLGDLMVGINPIYIKNKTKEIIRNHWREMYDDVAEQQSQYAKGKFLSTITREGMTQYLEGICMEEGIVPNKSIINTCFGYILIRPQILDARERGYKTFFTIEMPYEIPEFLMIEEKYEQLYSYNREYQMNWLYPYLRDQYLPKLEVDEPMLENCWERSYTYVGRHSKKTILNVWREAIKSDKITPHVENEGVQEIKMGSVKPRTITEIVNMKEKKIQDEPEIYFSNIELNNDIMALSEIHIFNNKYYKSFRLTNFKRQWKSLVEGDKENEFRYVVESKMYLSMTRECMEQVKITDCYCMKWRVSDRSKDTITIDFMVQTHTKGYETVHIFVELKKDEIEKVWKVNGIEGYVSIKLHTLQLNEFQIKGTEMEEKTYKELIKQRRDNLI